MTVFLASTVFFSVRFLRKGTATEIEPTETSTPAVETAGNKSIPEKKRSPEQAEMAPDGTIKELVRTWNQGNAEDIAGLFMSDGTLIIPTGSEIRSRAEIKKTIAEKRTGVLKETILTNTVDQVSRPDAETAVVQGTYKLDGVKILGISTSATGSYALRQVKRDGRWLILKAEVTGRDKG
ncbi:MAG: YybH family protein [Candidatus Binatia bacterium]